MGDKTDRPLNCNDRVRFGEDTRGDSFWILFIAYRRFLAEATFRPSRPSCQTQGPKPPVSPAPRALQSRLVSERAIRSP